MLDRVVRGQPCKAKWDERCTGWAEHGRTFLPEEDSQPGAHPVVVVSHRFWEENLDGDPRAVGRAITINGSGGIGWGLPAAVGGAIAKGDRRIVAAIGDGSALYASESLWTAGHHGTQILLVVFANRRYATLNEAATRLAGGALQSFTIEPPVLDFSGLATLYGWKYASAATQAELDALLARPESLSGNTVLELKLDPRLTPVTASRHF